MSFNLRSQSGWFYAFTGVHSALIGLFLFYTPVWLWQQGFTLNTILWAIAITNIAFMVGLAIWDRCRSFLSPTAVGLISLGLGWLTFVSIFAIETTWFLLLFCLLLGVYNAWLWSTQRALFIGLVNPNTSGQSYGNLQVFVFVVLQASIFAGAYLNSQDHYQWLLIVLTTISVLGGGLLIYAGKNLHWPATLKALPSVSLSSAWRFRDQAKSRFIFLLDGPFLFLESWFWLLSLFWLAGSSFWQLGWLVVGLALSFTVLFWILKQFVDRWEAAGFNIYGWAVALYGLSWFLRALIPEVENFTLLGILLVAVMFFTTYFRLLFNKRFYDTAHQTFGQKYLILKSYYSQIASLLFFGSIFLGLLLSQTAFSELSILYVLAGILSSGYFVYTKKY